MWGLEPLPSSSFLTLRAIVHHRTISPSGEDKIKCASNYLIITLMLS